eukprot:jgi/Chrzof1/12854/Cz07g09220.t1
MHRTCCCCRDVTLAALRCAAQHSMTVLVATHLQQIYSSTVLHSNLHLTQASAAADEAQMPLYMGSACRWAYVCPPSIP